MLKSVAPVSLCALSLLLSAPANAQITVYEQNWSVTAGAALVYAPVFMGSDDYQLLALPDVSVKYADSFFASVREGVGYNFYLFDDLKMGPLVKYDFGRDEDGDSFFSIAGSGSSALQGMGDLDGSVEVGGFIEYTFEPFVAHVDLRQGIGGHEGMVSDISLNIAGNTNGFGSPFIYSFGPRLKLADQEYMNAYYGVDAVQAANTGLSAYDADFGIVSYGVGANFLVGLTKTLSLSVFGSYDWLGDEASSSPLIEQRGKDEVFTVGLGLSYKLLP